MAGSAFVIFDITGWLLAGLMIFFGYALVGLWLLGLNYYFAQRMDRWPRRLAHLGLVSGAIIAIGLLTGPEIGRTRTRNR
jgi:putative copper export protein